MSEPHYRLYKGLPGGPALEFVDHSYWGSEPPPYIPEGEEDVEVSEVISADDRENTWCPKCRDYVTILYLVLADGTQLTWCAICDPLWEPHG